MPTPPFYPIYRLTAYVPYSVDATESTVLTPRAGAAHADPFVVASAQGIAGAQPYLGLPSGRLGRIDPVTKKVTIGTLTITLQDQRTTPGGSNANRWVTAFMGDASGKHRLLNRKVLLEESLDGGATWAAYFTGRITGLNLDDPIRVTFSLQGIETSMARRIFVRRPSTAQTYAFQSNLTPLGFPQAWGGFPAATPLSGTLHRNGALGRIAVADQTLDDRWRAMLVKSTATVTGQEQAIVTVGNQTGAFNIRWFDQQILDSPYRFDSSNTWYVERFKTSSRAPDHMNWAHIAYLTPVDPSDPLYMALPADGTPVTFYVVRNAQASKDLPYFIADVHPVQLLKDVADGKFSFLAADGSARPILPTEPTSFANLLADPSFGTVRFRITEPIKAVDFIEKYLCPYGLGYRINGAGQLVVLDLRRSSATVAGGTITDDDLAAPAPKWNVTKDGLFTGAQITYYADVPIPAESYKNSPDLFPDYSPSATETIENALLLLNPDPDVQQDTPDNFLTIDARGLHVMAGATASLALREQRYAQAAIQRIAFENLAAFSGGIAKLPLVCRRGSAAAANCFPGSWRTVQVTTQPDPASCTRGGPRLMLCLSRTDSGPTTQLEMLDAGPGSVAVTPSFGTVAADPDDPHAVDVTLALNAAGDTAVLQFAVTDTSTGSAPAATDARWQTAAPVTSATIMPLAVPGLPKNARIWLRARSLPVGQSLELPSAWTYPSAPSYVQLGSIAAPSGLATSNLFANRVDVAWAAGDATAAVGVYLVAGGVPASWTTAERVYLLDAGTIGPVRIRGLSPSTQYTIGVRSEDAWGGQSAMATITFVTGATAGTAPRPAAVDICPPPSSTPAPPANQPVPTMSTGIAVALYAADPAYTFEIQRAPDGSGAPNTGAATSVAPAVDGTHEVYVDRLPVDGATYWYRLRHTGQGDTASGWTGWVSGKAAAVPATIARPAPVPAALREQLSETATLGTLTLQITDPQSRVTLVEAKTQSGTGAETAYATMAGTGPYTQTVALVEKHTSRITYRVTGYNAAGALVVLAEQSINFSVGSIPAPPLLAVAVDASGRVTVTWQGDSDTGSVRVAASASGFPSAAAARAASVQAGRTGTTGTLLTLAPSQTAYLTAFAYSDAGGTANESSAAYASTGVLGTTYDACTATITGSDATTVTITVTSARGGTVQLVGYSNAAGGPISGAALGVSVASGSTWTFPRNGFQVGAGSARFEADTSGYVADQDSVVIPEQGRDTQYDRCEIVISASDGVSVTFSVNSLRGGTVKLLGYVNSAGGPTAGAGVGVAMASGSSWTFPRNAFRAGAGVAEFEVDTSGYVSDKDTIVIPEQGRDTTYDECRVSVVQMTPNALTLSAQSARGGQVQWIGSMPKIVVARKSSSMTGSTTALGERLIALGYDVTYSFSATMTDCRSYDLVVIDCQAWNCDEHSAFVLSLVDDGQFVLSSGNDTNTGYWPVASGVIANPVGTPVKAAGAYSTQDGWSSLPGDADSGIRITGLTQSAVQVLAYSDASADYAAFVIVGSRGGRLYHDQSLSNTATTATDYNRYLKNVVEDMSRLRRISGPVSGVASPSGQQWGFERPPFGRGHGVATFEANTSGYVSDRAELTIPELGRDTYPLVTSAAVVGTTATTVTVRVTVTDPVPQSGSYITLTPAPAGTGVTTSPSGAQSVANGGYVDFVVQRPGFRNGTGRVVFTAAATGRANGVDAVDVPEQGQDTQYDQCTASISGSDATTVTITVTSARGGQVKLVGYTNAAGGPTAGAAAGTLVASGSTWTFPRNAFQAGAGSATFEADTSGYVSDQDVVVIPEQGRDTVELTCRLEILSTSDATHVDVRVYAMDPLNAATGIAVSVYSNQGVAAPTTINGTSSPVNAGGHVDYRVTRPSSGSPVGRVVFHVSVAGRVDDYDAVDVPAADPIVPTLDVTPTISSTQYSIAFTSTGTVQYKVGSGSYAAATSPVVVNRNAYGGADQTVTFKAALNGQTVYQTVTVPAQAAPASPSITGVQLQVTTAGSQFEVMWTANNAPTGATYSIDWKVTESGANGHIDGAANPQTINTTLTSTPHGTATVYMYDSNGSLVATGKNTNNTMLL